jgi:cytochrome c oxidase subunit 2
VCPIFRHMHSAVRASLSAPPCYQALAAAVPHRFRYEGCLFSVDRRFNRYEQRTFHAYRALNWKETRCFSRAVVPSESGFLFQICTRGMSGEPFVYAARSWVNCEEVREMRIKGASSWRMPLAAQVIILLCVPAAALADPADRSLSPTNIFAPASTPAHSIFGLSLFVVAVTAAIFVIVFSLLVYCVAKFRKRAEDDGREPPQVYGSNQVELAWTVIPVLIIVVLFMATARVIASLQKAAQPSNAVKVVAIGHQFWWEYRYPGLQVVTANELHVPVSDLAHPTPIFISLLSADTDHSFWVPRLAGKTDLIPNHPNNMWFDPQQTGLYLGQCAQYCGTQHAKMLLRVYVQSGPEFARWIEEQSRPAQASAAVSEGQRIFETTACINCHAVNGTVADGRFGPDLTHLMSRETIAAGAAPNTLENLRLWIKNPDAIKPGSKMPAMGLSDHELDAVTAYLATLR